MTREEAIAVLQEISATLKSWNGFTSYLQAINMAIEALQFANHFDLLKEFQSLQEVVRCNDCIYQDECEEVVLFEVNDEEVMGHRIHWCSYGRSEK